MSSNMDDLNEINMVTVSEAAGAVQNDDYSWRAPSPPHIHVPPVPEKLGLSLPPSNPTPAEADVENEDTLKLLKWITGGDYEVFVKEWVYESRRNFQIILPFLYLGPFTAAKNVAALAKAGITMVLVVRDSMSAQSGFLSGKKAAETLGIHHAAVDVDGNAELINFGFTKATRLINEHLLMKFRELAPPDTPRDKTPGTWGKVLVFCESGNERSAAVIVAYLMAMYGIDLVASIQYVQTQRFCIAFDDNLKTLLLNYQQILEARRGVLGAQDSNLPSANPARPALVKRRIDDVDKEDYDMLSGEGDPDDVARFESRKPFAPFYDVE